ncbi:hypothetical protein W02_03600 [Nitrospira sp. KM1]|uniref:hypothetical protein n=1 Tax=Nitrospira sp. KM1 TaxID=1936990 RepID=UPI0013A74E94|nr:hypothetical protein [Nitrospira sp. KM1]BCA53220.1 hypothetical protein W02_03600 [Nitrospira sp. KM1]
MVSPKNYWALACCLVVAWSAALAPFVLAAPPAVDPCKVLTTAEVEQVVGKLKGTPTGDKEGEAGWCNYEFANGKDAMEVWVFPADGINRGRKVSKKPVTVKGLGDDAFMDRGMHGLDYVNLFIKKQGVTVKLSLKESAGDEDKLKTLAQKAVGRF